MSHNPCHHDCTDFPDLTDGAEDQGCCAPAPIHRGCEVPVIPRNDCDEIDPTFEFDEENETFSVLTNLYDQDCNIIFDQNTSPITTLLV